MLVRTYALALSAQGRNGLSDTVNQLLQKSNTQRQVRESRTDLKESLGMKKIEITCNKQSQFILIGDVMWKAFQTTKPLMVIWLTYAGTWHFPISPLSLSCS